MCRTMGGSAGRDVYGVHAWEVCRTRRQAAGIGPKVPQSGKRSCQSGTLFVSLLKIELSLQSIS